MRTNFVLLRWQTTTTTTTASGTLHSSAGGTGVFTRGENRSDGEGRVRDVSFVLFHDFGYFFGLSVKANIVIIGFIDSVCRV